MSRSLRAHRIEASEPLPAPSRASASRDPAFLGTRASASPHLDLGARITLAGDLQATAGNAATAQLLALVRTDRRQEPPGGLRALMDASGPGNRGLTRTSYTANPPLFRIRRTEQVGET